VATWKNDAEAAGFAEDHLIYELRSLRHAAQQMGAADQATENMAVESFALHLRNWEDFFYPPTNPRPDDVTYLDYVDRTATPPWQPRPCSPQLTTASGMAGKQIAHITKQRYPGGHPAKNWNSRWAFEIYALLCALAQNANLARLPEVVRREFLAAPGDLPTTGATGIIPPVL
jgi:hypothetical protein